jgi:hypothetical protein
LPSDAQQIIAMVKDDPTTLYIYPASKDIDAVAQAVAAGGSFVAYGIVLECLLLEGNRLSEILAEGNPRAGRPLNTRRIIRRHRRSWRRFARGDKICSCSSPGGFRIEAKSAFSSTSTPSG